MVLYGGELEGMELSNGKEKMMLDKRASLLRIDESLERDKKSNEGGKDVMRS